jgi:hypothetical protein
VGIGRGADAGIGGGAEDEVRRGSEHEACGGIGLGGGAAMGKTRGGAAHGEVVVLPSGL